MPLTVSLHSLGVLRAGSGSAETQDPGSARLTREPDPFLVLCYMMSPVHLGNARCGCEQRAVGGDDPWHKCQDMRRCKWCNILWFCSLCSALIEVGAAAISALGRFVDSPSSAADLHTLIFVMSICVAEEKKPQMPQINQRAPLYVAGNGIEIRTR